MSKPIIKEYPCINFSAGQSLNKVLKPGTTFDLINSFDFPLKSNKLVCNSLNFSNTMNCTITESNKVKTSGTVKMTPIGGGSGATITDNTITIENNPPTVMRMPFASHLNALPEFKTQTTFHVTGSVFVNKQKVLVEEHTPSPHNIPHEVRISPNSETDLRTIMVYNTPPIFCNEVMDNISKERTHTCKSLSSRQVKITDPVSWISSNDFRIGRINSDDKIEITYELAQPNRGSFMHLLS